MVAFAFGPTKHWVLLAGVWSQQLGEMQARALYVAMILEDSLVSCSRLLLSCAHNGSVLSSHPVIFLT